MSLFGSSEITGIDIGAGSIKAVRIKPGKQPKLLAAGMVEFPAETEGVSVSAELRALLSQRKLGEGSIVTQLPGKDLMIRFVSMPRMPQEELREAVRWEAKRHISYALDDALVEHLVCGERRDGAVEKTEVLLVAAEESRVREHLSPLEEAGLKVSAVDANALALRNVLRLSGENGADTLLVDIGAGKMEIDIFKNGLLRFSRCLATGGADITRLIAEHLDVGLRDAEERKRNANLLSQEDLDGARAVITQRLDALLMEIRRSVEYYKTTFREKGVGRAVLTGGAVLMKGLPEYVAQALGIPVELQDPFAPLTISDALREEFGPFGPRFSTAVGLALRKA